MGNTNGKASVILKNGEENEELTGNNNCVEDGEKEEEKGKSGARSSGPSVPKFGEWDLDESEEEQKEGVFGYSPRHGVPKAIQGEQGAAGWPSWLSSVGAEAIQGWVPRTIESFTILDKIGEGSYSTVFRARDHKHNRLVALKKVWFDNLDHKTVTYAAKEILIMRRLDHPNVIKLEGVVILRRSPCLYLVLEYMEHDFARLASTPYNISFNEPEIKCYMQQLLCGLEHCHNQGILHRDIKTSNLLVNNDGLLKIADFGLSTFFNPHRRIPLTSHVVTLWYRPPELLLGATNYGVEVDLWSTGCVLGELYAGRPILKGGTEVEQLYKIFKLCGSPSEDYWRKLKLPHKTVFKPQMPYIRCLRETFISFPDVTIRLLETLLSLDPKDRGTAYLALKSEFFMTEPFACDPSMMPKYLISGKAIHNEYKRRTPSVHVERSDAKAELAGLKDKNKLHRNIVQMLEEHERSILEVAQPATIEKPIIVGVPSKDKAREHEERHYHSQEVAGEARLQKIKVNKVESQGTQTTGDPVDWKPLYDPLKDVDKMLEEHDRNIQEVSWKARVEKRKVGKVQAGEVRLTVNKAGFVPAPSPVPSCNVDQLLEEHDRLIQESFRQSMLEKKRVGKMWLNGANNK